MTTATKVVRCVASFSYASLSPAATLQRGLTAQLRRRFISSSGKDAEAAVKVGLEDRRIGAGNFMNQAGLKPVGVDVGNGLMAGATVSPSTSIFKQTTIIDVGSRPISLDMQATTPTDPCMLDAMLAVYTSLYRNPHSLTHAHGWETEKVIDAACEHVTKLIEAHPKEIIFTSGATDSNNLSIKCVARFYKSKKHIITLQRKHKCVLNSCRHLQDQGYDITYLPVKNNGLINLEHLEKEIRPDIALVSIMTINNEIGVIQPMEMGKLCQKKGVFFHTDGAQAVGKIPVDIGKWNVDLISISGPKVYGPKGIGVGYIHHRPKVRIEPLISGGGQERGLRSRTLAHSLVIGSGEACRIAQEQIEYTCTLKPFFSLTSICSSTVRDDSYIHKRYHNKQPKQFTRTLRTMGHDKADTKRSKCKANTGNSNVGIQVANLTEVQKRKRKWTTSYSKMTIPEAETRLNVELNFLGIPVEQMLEGKSVLLGPDTVLQVKRKVYRRLVEYMNVMGYPSEANPDFKEANINDIVGCTIYPMLDQFKHDNMRNLRLSREKEITSKDSSTGGMEEFVVVNYISYRQKQYVLIVEAKKVSLVEARKQCFLAMKDMWDCNGGGTVYGFVTMGDSWRMISFDGTFKMSEKIELMFDSMGKNEERWMAAYSILIDCFNVALSNGAKDLVEVV